MSTQFWNKLCHLGYLPYHGYLPSVGTRILQNLDHVWTESHLRGGTALLPVDQSLSEPHLHHKSVAYRDAYTVAGGPRAVRARLCQKCAALSTGYEVNAAMCCSNFDISNLNFTEDKILTGVQFFPDAVSHAGLLQLDGTTISNSVYHRLLRNYNGESFTVDRDEGDNVVRVIGKFDHGIELVVQESSYALWKEGYYALKTVISLTNWYMALVLDKFSAPDTCFHPHVAPYHVAVIPSDSEDEDVAKLSRQLVQMMAAGGVQCRMLDDTQQSENLGVPFDLVVDRNSVIEDSIVVYDRTRREHQSIPNIKKIPEIFRLYWNSVID